MSGCGQATALADCRLRMDFSAVIEGVMIVVATLLIVREAYKKFLDPQQLSAPLEGFVVNGTASAREY